MDEQWYSEESSYLAADSLCGGEPAGALLGSASPSSLASQIRELLGEDFELEASFLEESWVSGRSMSAAGYGRKRNQVVENDGGVTFGQLNTLGSFFFSPANELMRDCSTYARPDESANSYRAAWLRDPLEEFASRIEDHSPSQDSAGYETRGREAGTLGSMTYRRACELLSVREDSTVPQIRAAYRRMVGEWHPDRLEQRGEKVRALATKQMAANNEAYHLLRDVAAAPAC